MRIQIWRQSIFLSKITCTCVLLMVARIGHNWDAAAVQPLIAPIVQTMAVVHNTAGIESCDEYDELRESLRAAAKNLLQGFRETNNRGAKAFRDRARELIMPFFVDGDSTMEEHEKYLHVMLSTFGITGSTVKYPRHPTGQWTSCAPGLHGNSAADRAR
jgi:hypothetical protein